MSRLRNVAAFVVALAVTPRPALGWGGPGHRIVAAIAEDRLSAQAQAMVREIVGSEPLSDPAIASWADQQRDPRSRPYHYVNIPLSAARYDEARDCPRSVCVVTGIENATVGLIRGTSARERADALRWLVHLVADVHQPLHAGDGWDRGGNGVRVRLGKRKQPTNLHRVWDVDVVRPLDRLGGPLAEARRLEAKTTPADARAWSSDLNPASWANESHREAKAIYDELGITPRERGIVQLPQNYFEAERARVEGAMMRAGVRLAAMLDAVAVARQR